MRHRYKTTRGLKKHQIRKFLITKGYDIYYHHFTQLKTELIIQLLLNRLTHITGSTFPAVIHQLNDELDRLHQHAEELPTDEKGTIYRQSELCLIPNDNPLSPMPPAPHDPNDPT
jgi:hypothetical protein